MAPPSKGGFGDMSILDRSYSGISRSEDLRALIAAEFGMGWDLQDTGQLLSAPPIRRIGQRESFRSYAGGVGT